MLPCRKLPDYTSLTTHADCMWHGINRVEICEFIDEVYEQWCIENQFCFKLCRVLKETGSLRDWQTVFSHLLGIRVMKSFILGQHCSRQQTKKIQKLSKKSKT